MVHDDSHSTLRLNADSISRRAGSIPMAAFPAMANESILIPAASAKISIFGDITGEIGINYQYLLQNHEFIPMASLDAIDRKILGLLQTDGRMTMQELADKVGLS